MQFTEEERQAWQENNDALAAHIRREQARLEPPNWIWTDQPSEEPAMKMTYKSPNGRLEFEVDITSGKQAFEVVSRIAELFEEPNCGCCASVNIRPEVREVSTDKSTFTYYNLKCIDCGAQLGFGQKKDGKSLFAKRWDADNKCEMPDRGWFVWQREEGKERAPAKKQDEEPQGEEIPF